MTQLHYKPGPVREWWKGLEQRIEREKFIRRTDLMSLSEISERYEKGLMWCDTCISDMPLSDKLSLRDHILHMVNSSILWSCDNCLVDDYKNGRVLGAQSEEDVEWLKQESLTKTKDNLK